MEHFWFCTNCGSANSYPDIKICDVCGKPIDAGEIKLAEQAIKESEKAIRAIELEEKKELEEKARQEKEQREKELLRQKLIEKQQREQQEKELLRKKLLEKENRKKEKIRKKRKFYLGWESLDIRFSASYKRLLSPLRVLLVIACCLGLVATAGLVVIHGEEAEIEKIQTVFPSKIETITEMHTETDDDGNIVLPMIENIKNQGEEIYNRFENSEVIETILEIVGW